MHFVSRTRCSVLHELFGNGELNRLTADALRRAKKPLASSDIADAIVEAKGYGRESIHTLTRRVRANLSLSAPQ
jgi:hypothetical protein